MESKLHRSLSKRLVDSLYKTRVYTFRAEKKQLCLPSNFYKHLNLVFNIFSKKKWLISFSSFEKLKNYCSGFLCSKCLKFFTKQLVFDFLCSHLLWQFKNVLIPEGWCVGHFELGSAANQIIWSGWMGYAGWSDYFRQWVWLGISWEIVETLLRAEHKQTF